MRQRHRLSTGRALYNRAHRHGGAGVSNIRHHKRMSRFTLRGKAKVSTQWQLYCLVHNIEKIAMKAMRTGCRAATHCRAAASAHVAVSAH